MLQRGRKLGNERIPTLDEDVINVVQQILATLPIHVVSDVYVLHFTPYE